MSVIKVDGREIEIADDQNLLAGLLQAGVDLPYFCWHPTMGSVGACRLCAVKQYNDDADTRGRVIWRSDSRRCQGCDGAADRVPALDDNRRQITDPIAAFQMVNILQGVVQRGTGGRAATGLNRPVAGKTGTTDDYKDAWFIGFTPDIVIAVWVGYDDPRTLRRPGEQGADVTGGRLAAPIFRDVLAAALQGSPAVPFRAPPGVSLVRIQTDAGQTIMEAFRPGTENAATPPDAGIFAPGAAQRVESGLGGLY